MAPGELERPRTRRVQQGLKIDGWQGGTGGGVRYEPIRVAVTREDEHLNTMRSRFDQATALPCVTKLSVAISTLGVVERCPRIKHAACIR